MAGNHNWSPPKTLFKPSETDLHLFKPSETELQSSLQKKYPDSTSKSHCSDQFGNMSMQPNVSYRGEPFHSPHVSHNIMPRSKKYNGTEGLPRPIIKTNSNAASHTVTSGVEWANAPEFIPKGISNKPKSYAEVVNPRNELSSGESSQQALCPYLRRTSLCRYTPHCPYIHGDLCEVCHEPVLHPTDNQQRKLHHDQCLEHHKKETELANAINRSKDKSCGICFEVVIEKQHHERRFGILPQCNHCFCLTCIRTWRQARQFENTVVRACPECRVTSDFVCPSLYWVDTKEEKDKLIDNYKSALAEKECKYFRQGQGRCPFGNKCFYLHALADGTKTDVGPPPRRRRNNNPHRYRLERDLTDTLQQLFLLDFTDDTPHYLYSVADDIEEFVEFFSDSDESEWSDYDFLLD